MTMDPTVITYYVDPEESIEDHFRRSATRMQQQPLPSLFAPPPPGYMEPQIVYPQFIEYSIQPQFTPMSDQVHEEPEVGPTDSVTEEGDSVTEEGPCALPEDLQDLSDLDNSMPLTTDIEAICEIYLVCDK